MPRIDFSPATKRIIAARAGHRCSFPECGVPTSGPGVAPDDVVTIGVAAHIFSASPNGPRGQGGLSAFEIGNAANGIWFCPTHARLVDASDGAAFPAEALHRYKREHEQRILALVSSARPNHLARMRVTGPLLPFRGHEFSLAKLTLVLGNNGSGKTSFLSTLSSYSDPCRFWRRIPPARSGHIMEVEFFTSERHYDFAFSTWLSPSGSVQVERRRQGRKVFALYCSSISHASCAGPGISVQCLARWLGVSDAVVHMLIFELRQVSTTFRDLEITEHGQLRGACLSSSPSSGQAGRLKIEIAAAFAESIARQTPTLLLLDDFQNQYGAAQISLLSDPRRRSQTVITDTAPPAGWNRAQDYTVLSLEPQRIGRGQP